MTALDALPDYLREQAVQYRLQKAKQGSSAAIWQPFKGKPQEMAYHSQADILLYGGAAGGGKSDLLLGLGFTAHEYSIIFRREYPQLKGLIRRGNQILKSVGVRYVSGDVKAWRLPNRTIELGAVQYEDDVEKFQGQPHDLIEFDELAHFTESQFRFLLGWNRTDNPRQRVRVVGASNPPLSLEQEWIIDFWAAWVDEEHPNPAAPGELRWYITLDDEDIEVTDGNPVPVKGEYIQPRSRTFIPAFVEDNPVYMETGYKAVLQALPSEIQPALLRGQFRRFKGSHPYQVIPTQWVIDAQERWKNRSKPDLRMRAMAVDVARGGNDQTVIAKLYGNWFAELETLPGKETPDGDAVAEQVKTTYEGCDKVGIDVVGVGSSPYDLLKKVMKITPINSGEGTHEKDESGKFGFSNLRALMWWRFREALDPKNGHEIALPTDRELRADLCAPQYKLVGANYKVESKDDIRERLKRSTDKGDAIVMAWYMANPIERRVSITEAPDKLSGYRG